MDRAIMVNHLDSWGFPKENVLRFAFLNSYYKTDQKYPLDDAILAYAYTNGYRFQASKWKKLDEIPFDFVRRKVSVILETESITEDRSSQFSGRFVITKGALEEVIKVCSFVEHMDSGPITSFTSEEQKRILNLGEELSNEGLRVIGVAVKRLLPVSSDFLEFPFFDVNYLFHLFTYYNFHVLLFSLVQVEAMQNHYKSTLFTTDF